METCWTAGERDRILAEVADNLWRYVGRHACAVPAAMRLLADLTGLSAASLETLRHLHLLLAEDVIPFIDEALPALDRALPTCGDEPTRASGWVVSSCAGTHRARAGLHVVLAGRVCVAHGRPEMAPWSRSGYPTRAVISAVAA